MTRAEAISAAGATSMPAAIGERRVLRFVLYEVLNIISSASGVPSLTLRVKSRAASLFFTQANAKAFLPLYIDLLPNVALLQRLLFFHAA